MSGRSMKRSRERYANERATALYINLQYCPGLRDLAVPIKLALVNDEFLKWNGKPEIHPRRMTFIEQQNPKISAYWTNYWIDERNLYRAATGHYARHFRRMFRMSHGTLVDFISIAKRENWFPSYKEGVRDAAGRPASPLELLIMGTLAHLGGMPFHQLYIVTYISENTHRRFFKSFCEIGARDMFSMWVKPPTTKEEIKKASEAYTMAGMPGAFASTDGVRVRLWSCSHSLRNQHIGKEGHPVRTFQVTVGYNGEIYACTEGCKGRDPDIKITEHDPFLCSVRDDPKYTQFKWKYKSSTGEDCTMEGAWILVDGGYPDWIILQYPTKNSTRMEDIRWGKMLESLRKDVERVFGILKQRFVVLKKGLSFESLVLVDNVFHTCCALHNFLLLTDEQNVQLDIPLVANEGLVQRMYRPKDMEHYVEANGKKKRNVQGPSGAYLVRRKLLVDHFNYQLDKQQVFWPNRGNAGFVRRRLASFEANDEKVNYDMENFDD
jgi:hypothetical protein